MNMYKQQGATLIEILITVLVMSVGLLGMATLQIKALQQNNDAMLRTKAVMLSDDIVNRMRSNRTAAIAGDYDITLSANAPTGSTIADSDLNQWLTAIAGNLPSGDGAVNVIATASKINEAKVQVCWDEDRGGNAPATCFSFVTGL